MARNLRRLPPLLDCTSASVRTSSTSPASMRRSMRHCATSATSVMATASLQRKKLGLGSTSDLWSSRTCSQPAAVPSRLAPWTSKLEAGPSHGPWSSSTTSPVLRLRIVLPDASASVSSPASCAHHMNGFSVFSMYAAPALLWIVTQPEEPSCNTRHCKRSRLKPVSALGAPVTSSSSPRTSFRMRSDLTPNSLVRLMSRTTLR
mmetsp:Transcript_6287/g.17140  ORF Transcript_6287/g.17140 Transcript_6287/m.17140 type:complete len:204 (+) Transcript_6287:1037-1648(+)